MQVDNASKRTDEQPCKPIKHVLGISGGAIQKQKRSHRKIYSSSMEAVALHALTAQ